MLKITSCKNGGIDEKWTPNSLNFNVNFPNLVHMCGYKLPITEQNLAQKKGLAKAKILLVLFWGRGYFFDSPCRRCDLFQITLGFLVIFVVVFVIVTEKLITSLGLHFIILVYFPAIIRIF